MGGAIGIAFAIIFGTMGHGVNAARYDGTPPAVCRYFDTYYNHKQECETWKMNHRRQ